MRTITFFFALFLAVTASAQIAPTPCSATTKAGTPCSRKAEEGSSLCWQHARVLLVQDTTKTAATVKTQCTATTKAGARCKNRANGDLCHVHKK